MVQSYQNTISTSDKSYKYIYIKSRPDFYDNYPYVHSFLKLKSWGRANIRGTWDLEPKLCELAFIMWPTHPEFDPETLRITLLEVLKAALLHTNLHIPFMLIAYIKTWVVIFNQYLGGSLEASFVHCTSFGIYCDFQQIRDLILVLFTLRISYLGFCPISSVWDTVVGGVEFGPMPSNFSEYLNVNLLLILLERLIIDTQLQGDGLASLAFETLSQVPILLLFNSLIMCLSNTPYEFQVGRPR